LFVINAVKITSQTYKTTCVYTYIWHSSTVLYM